ncbi:MAG: CoA transferase [Dehalococcoidia bacterium]
MSISLPLEGVRVVDLCVVWAGPFGTMQLADLGAEVIKVENVHVWQPMTRGGMARPTPALLSALTPWAGGYPNAGDLARPWNACPTFVQLFRNKHSVTIDYTTPLGREAFERLVKASDVVYENNVTETMEKLGITYEYVRGLKPDIIMLRAPAYGSDGPYMNYRALGVHLEGVSGHSLLRHYPDTDPTTNTLIYAGDYFAGTHGAFAVIAALEHRRLTGEGQLIEIGQAETAEGMLAQYAMDYALNGRSNEAIGNRDLHGGVPCNVFRTAGEDRWLALTVYGDEQWQRCARIMGGGTLLDERFATEGGRRTNESELERLIGAAVKASDVNDLTRALQAEGIAAGPVMDARDVLNDEHANARGVFVEAEMAETGPNRWPGPLWHWSDAPVTVRKAPARLGEDNDYVYREVLGYTEAEYERFKESGMVGMDYDATIP